MTRVVYNGGPDVFVGLSTEPKPTAADDGISEGARIYLRDTQTLQCFSGNDEDAEPWTDVCTFS